MQPSVTRVFQWLAIASVPLALFGFSSGPPIKRTGAPVDGGLNCSVCHRTFGPANSGPGRIRIDAVAYTPGTRQTITITIEDPDGQRWGFQLTARLGSDLTKPAGTFTANDNIRVRCDPDERDAPCNGALEFASHRQPSTRPGTGGPGVFEVEWTPPAEDVGEIVFYAAGNAANNSGTNLGDHIYTTSTILRPACNLTGTPTVLGTTDAAAYRPVISSNTLISIFGTGFATPTAHFIAARSDLVDGKLPTQFGCVAVEIGGRRAPVLYVQNNQINAQAPFLLQNGEMDLRVIVNAGASNEIRGDAMKVQVNTYSPGLFAGAILPARAGEITTVYGTGFGFTEPVYQPGEYAHTLAPLRDPYTVSIGGTALAAADIEYAGLSALAPGVYEFRLRVPSSLPAGNAPLVIRVGGQEAAATLPVER